jgi:hypothetical protein
MTIQDVNAALKNEDRSKGPQKWTDNMRDLSAHRIVSKLFTNEDSMQIHKVLGLLCISSFIYRYFWVYPTTGSLGFTGTWFDHTTMLLHFLLSSSSLIFHVIARRIINRPMIIWEGMIMFV